MVPCCCEDCCHGNERISAIHCQHRSSFHSHVYSTVTAKDFVQLNHTIHRWTPHDNAWFLSWVNNAQESCDRIHSHTCFLLVIKTWQDTCKHVLTRPSDGSHITILKQSHKDLFKPSRTHCVAQCNRICHEHVMALKSPGVSSLVDRHDRFWSLGSKVNGRY